jgi:hypothetical protein
VIEQAIAGRGTGVQIGDGSLYDLVVEEILAGGEAPLESVAEAELEFAMQLLADARAARTRSSTTTVEEAFEAAHRRRLRRRRRR